MAAPKAARARFAPVEDHHDLSAGTVVDLPRPSDADGILIQATGQALRMTLDGTAPTTTKGFQLATAAPPLYIPLAGDTIVKVLQESASGRVQAQWVKEC